MIIPKPLECQQVDGAFTFPAQLPVIIAYHPDQGYAHFVAEELAQQLRVVSGAFVTINEGEAGSKPGTILLTDRDAQADLGPEGYQLDISPECIRLCAGTNAGLFYALQSLLQILDHERASLVDDAQLKSLPCMSIKDKPQFGWRGFMLDSARHFQPIEVIYKIIDQLAALKLNRFHWHLSDDQGWRLEVLGFPKLTSVGAWRNNGKARYGGFYTREQVRVLVAYAHQRHITIVPEIDIPGHSFAALAAYPEYGCPGKEYTVQSGWGILQGTFCAGNEQTFRFLGEVFADMAEVFSGPYLHLGGDERKPGVWEACPKCSAAMKNMNFDEEAKLHRWFMERVSKRVHESLCRRTIAWGDNIEAGGVDGQIVQGWIAGQSVAAAKQGLDTINSTNTWVYFDYPESEEGIGTTWPKWMKPLPIEMVHAFDPIPEDLDPQLHKHVLGSECHLWTEHVPDEATIRRQIIPRIHAFSEAVWTPTEGRDFDDFSKRLKHQRTLF